MARRAKRLIPGGTQLLSKRPEMFLPGQWPAYYKRAEGARIWDVDGREYIDMSLNGVGACPLGYADPDVNAAVKEAMDAGSASTLNCPEEVELAELLCNLHPWSDMVRFARGGGEAMAIAVRIARAWTGRTTVAFCGYHGWCDWYLAANLGGVDRLGEGLLLPGLDPRGVPRALEGSALTFHYNRPDELEAVIDRAGHDLAAIVCEPQRSEKPAPGFLEGMRAAAVATGAALIFDEVTSAMRLTVGGVHRLYGVEPDIAVFAKGIGNGVPIAAVIGREEVMQAAQDTFISSTSWSERIGPTAALATIEKFQRQHVDEHLIEAGRKVQKGWRTVIDACDLDAEVGHPDMPPLSHFHYRGADSRAAQTLHCQLMLERGILDNCAFYATYTHTEEIIDAYLKTVDEVVPLVAEARRRGVVHEQLRGPIGHSGFARII